MSRIDNFFMKTNMWYVWLSTCLVTSAIWWIVWVVMNRWLFHDTAMPTKPVLFLIMGFLLGSMITAMIKIGRNANEFFREAEDLELKIKKATSKEDLALVYNRDFQNLCKKSFHERTGARLREISSVAKARFDLLPNKQGND